MPCLNEAETLEGCIRAAQAWVSKSGVDAEILVADNGSQDGSGELARRLGARVLAVPQRGYGAAIMQGVASAQGDWVILGDADGSYDFSRLDPYWEALRGGAELVMGDRFQGGIAPGAMPLLNRYLGNPALSWAARWLFGSPVRDIQCGLRGVRRDAFLGLGLQAQGMEFASEMVIRATLKGLRISQVPTPLAKDGRTRPPHLRPWRDGFRNLWLMLRLKF